MGFYEMNSFVNLTIVMFGRNAVLWYDGYVVLNGDASDAMEQIITRFSMEPGVYYIGYKKNEEYEDN